MAGAVPYRKHYTPEQAERYARVKEEAAWTHRAETRLARRALALLPPGAHVLDVPCGAGRLSTLLHAMGFRVHAADVSPAMVELARVRFATAGLDIPVDARDLEGTGYADGRFDALFCFRLFHHFPDDAIRAQAAREMCRIARGHVVVSYLDARSFTSRKRALQVRLGRKRPGKFPLAPGAMARFFTDCGYRVEADLARFPLLHSLRVLVARRA